MENNQTTCMLSIQEMESITGGTEERGLLGTLAYIAGATVRSIIEFSNMTMQYQQSLPANLKK